MGRTVDAFDPNERLLERILSKENMETAWRRVKANHGAPGVDGIAIEQFMNIKLRFPDHTRELWAGIRKSLLAGTYQPSPVRRVEIPKPTGGTRPLGIPEKSRGVPTNQAAFLGFTFRGAKIHWSAKAFREFKRRVKELTGRSWFVSMEYRYRKLAEYLRGWMNYFGISEYYRPIPEIDHWLRRRLRMCYFKQGAGQKPRCVNCANWVRRFMQPSQWPSAVRGHGTCPGRWQRKLA